MATTQDRPDPVEDLTRRWAAAWARARGLEVGEVAGWPKVYVAAASRATEIVCAEPDQGTWCDLLEQVRHQPTAMLTVVSHRGEQYRLPLGVRLDRDDETLMRQQYKGLARRHAAMPGFDVDRVDDGDRITVRLVTGGRVAAEGTVGLLGADAAYDQVETLPAYRRRGLASWVMTELGLAAARRGARTGLLVATAQGAALYPSLGWGEVAPARSVRGEAAGYEEPVTSVAGR